MPPTLALDADPAEVALRGAAALHRHVARGLTGHVAAAGAAAAGGATAAAAAAAGTAAATTAAAARVAAAAAPAATRAAVAADVVERAFADALTGARIARGEGRQKEPGAQAGAGCNAEAPTRRIQLAEMTHAPRLSKPGSNRGSRPNATGGQAP